MEVVVVNDDRSISVGEHVFRFEGLTEAELEQLEFETAIAIALEDLFGPSSEDDTRNDQLAARGAALTYYREYMECPF